MHSPLAASLRFALVAPSVESIVALRAGLIHDVIMRRHRVLCVTPPAAQGAAHDLRDLGVQHRTVAMDAGRPSFLAAWKATRELTAVFEDWKPEVVMGIGMREMAYAALAGRRARARRVVSLLSGLPSEDVDGSARRRLRRAVHSSDALVFDNDDDRRRLTPLIPPDMPSVVVPGAGVDLHRHSVKPLPTLADGLVFLMVSPLERSRGVLNYARAARELKDRAPGCRFLLAGLSGSGDEALIPEDVTAASSGALEYLGSLEDVRETLGQCHVFVYPSHAEGMPQPVLEALATGRPVITTDAAGCRDTVDDMVSGCLVAPGDTKALAAAMQVFVKRPEIVPSAGRAARLKAERRFDRARVNRTLLEVLGL